MKKPSLNNDDNFQIFLQGRNKKAKYLKYDLSLFSKGTNKIELISDSFDGDTTIVIQQFTLLKTERMQERFIQHMMLI